MKKRKPNNMRTRLERFSRSVLRQYRVAVVNIDPAGRQGLIDYGTAKNIAPGRHVADAVCDIAHPWVIYIGAFCVDQNGQRYIKATEIAPQGIYRSDALADVMEEHYRALLDTCNPAHVIGSGWIANPNGVSLTEEQADRIFEACGAWSQKEKAA
jgi:hypothetical protein